MGPPAADSPPRRLTCACRGSSEGRSLIDEALGVVLLAECAEGSARDRAAGVCVNAAFTQLALALHRGPVDLASATAALMDAFRFAHAAVEKVGRRGDTLQTTACALVGGVFLDTHVVIGNIGNSRAYRVRQGLANATAAGIGREPSVDSRAVRPVVHLLTLAIGGPVGAEPDVHIEALAEGDVLVFCSDQLGNVLERHAAPESLFGGESLDIACERLIATTGADHDVTFVLARAVRVEEP